MKKSILCLLLVFIMGFALIGTACTDKGDSPVGSQSEIESETTSELPSESEKPIDYPITLKDKEKTLFVGETYDIEVIGEENPTYVSSDENIARVAANGKVTAVSDGTAFVTVKSDKASVTMRINVITSSEYIRLSATEAGIIAGGERTIKAEVIENGEVSDGIVAFSCEDENLVLKAEGNSVTISSEKTGYYTVAVSCGELKSAITVKIVDENAKILANPTLSEENCVTLTWNEVENADGYKIAINGNAWTDVSGNSFDISDYTADLKFGETAVFAVRAVAKNDFGYFDGFAERLVFAHDYSEEILEPFTCASAGRVNYTCLNCGKNYIADGVLAEHKIKDGACEVCGKIVTEKILYLYDDINECYYVGGADGGFDEEEVYILAEYDDGKNGRHPVRYFGISAFAGNDTIKKVIIPESITEFKDKRGAYNNINKNGEMLSSPLRGQVFDACTNLEFVSMKGITALPAIASNVICDADGNYVRTGVAENLLPDEIAKGYTAEYVDYTHDNFRDCSSLTAVIVGDGFRNDGRSWMAWLYTTEEQKHIADIYVDGEIKYLDTDSYRISSTTGANNNILSGKVFRYEANSTKCYTWHYDENGEFVSNGKHEFKNGVCKKCYAYDNYGIEYTYDVNTDSYYVDNNTTVTDAEINILAVYDDGEHGEKPVTFVKKQAFINNEVIKKVTLPESVIRLDGGVFQGCSALEYVSMTGINAMAFRNLTNTGIYAGSDDEAVTNNNFLNCFALRTLIVGKNFNLYADSDGAQQFIGLGDCTPCIDIYVNGEKSESEINATPNSRNNLLTGKVYYKGDLSRCGEWKLSKKGEIVISEHSEHNYVDGVCSYCGDRLTYGVNYLYDEEKDVYYVSSYAGTDGEVNVLDVYDDGTHGEKAVTYVRNGAFKDNNVIVKVILPESVTRLEGDAFLNCRNLEYVSMVGVKELTLENLSNKGIYDGEAYSTNNFLNCASLKTVIVGKEFKITGNHFIINGDDTIAAGKADLYMGGSKAECSFTFNPEDRNEILSGTVFYLGDLSACREWKFDENGNVVTSARNHDYVNGKCVNCGDYLTNGVTYSYDENLDVYYVNGYNGEDSEVTVLAEYNDGTHGEKTVTYVRNGAFKDNNVIVKVILPESVIRLDGGVFEGCSALEYVSMTGINAMAFRNLTNTGIYAGSGDETVTNNNFLNCFALRTLIVGKNFNLYADSDGAQQFIGLGDCTPCIDIYVNGEKSESEINATPNSRNNLLTGKVYYRGDLSRCGEWKFDENGNIVTSARNHDYVNGKCANCGEVQTKWITYAYDETNDVYYVAGYTGSDKEVYVLSEYEGKPVTYVKFEAFKDNTNITKVILPESVTDLDGNAFANCSNLKYVSMTGVKTLNYGETTRPYGTRYGNNNFMNCVSLETVVVSDEFSSNVAQFILHGETAEKIVRFFVNGASGAPALQDDALLTGTVYYYSEVAAENAWHYVNGEATLW